MAISVLQHASATANFTSGTSGTVAPAFASNTTAGSTLVACISMNNDIGTTTVTAVTTNGTAENWAQAVTDAAGSAAGWWDKNTGGGQKIVDVTVAFGGTSTANDSTTVTVDIYEIAGMGSTPALDQTGSADSPGAATSWSSGNITTVQPSEIVFGLNNGTPLSGASFTQAGPASPWTNETALTITGTQGGASIFYSALSGFDILTGTSTVAYAGTASIAVFTNTVIFSIASSAAAAAAIPNRPAPVLPKTRAPRRAVLIRVTAAAARGKPNCPAPVLPKTRAPRRAVLIRTAGTSPAPVIPGIPNRPAPVLPRLRPHPGAVVIRTTGTAPAAVTPGTPNRLAPVLPRRLPAKRAVIIRNPIVIPAGPVTPPGPVSGGDRVHPWRKHPWPRTPIGIPLIDLSSAFPDAAEILPPDPAQLAPDHVTGAGEPAGPAGPGITERARTAARDAIAAAAAAAARNVPDSGALSSPDIGDAVAYWQQQRNSRRRQ